VLKVPLNPNQYYLLHFGVCIVVHFNGVQFHGVMHLLQVLRLHTRDRKHCSLSLTLVLTWVLEVSVGCLLMFVRWLIIIVIMHKYWRPGSFANNGQHSGTTCVSDALLKSVVMSLVARGGCCFKVLNIVITVIW